MMVPTIPATIVTGVGCVASISIVIVGGVMVTVVPFLRNISNSVGIAKPTTAMLRDENPTNNCILFRHLPHLSKNLAWRSLGALSPTPVHRCEIPSPSSDDIDTNTTVEILLKREDLISKSYGGNKVRTLQHQLAVCESRRENGETAFQQLVSIGSGGSNQVVATVVHARKLGWDNNNINNAAINACWFDSDEPDIDNTLNMLSVLSFPNVGFTFDWGMKVPILSMLRTVHKAWTQKEFIPMMLGGNCPVGVLGQVGGILELAEQIQAGESPDPDRIYVPVGSGCTVSGLILGVCLARHLKLKAFVSPDFKIIGCNVHPVFACLDRFLGIHTNPLFKFMPLTITHSIAGACCTLKQLGGPDLKTNAMNFLRTGVELRSDGAVVGKYGAHSEKSREMANLYDDKGIVTDCRTRKKEKRIWICGHFVAKAFQPLLKDIEEAKKLKNLNSDNNKRERNPKYMLWMTKSAVQPKGNEDEWSKFKKSSDAVKKWASDGKAESKLRPGKVNMNGDGKAEDYRSIMTKVI